MSKVKKNLLAFNRGIISKLGLARIDLERMALSAEQMVNWIPRVLGSMMLRPGLEYIDNSRINSRAWLKSFIFGVDDTALIAFSEGVAYIYVNDVVQSTNTVTTTITNPDFSLGTGWIDADDTNGVSSIGSGYCLLRGDNTDYGRRTQQVTVTAGDQGVEHMIYVTIAWGPVTVKVGSATQTDDYFEETVLEKGNHYLTFTPNGDFHITLEASRKYDARVNSCNVYNSGTGTTFELPHGLFEEDLPYLRIAQSGDVLYCACWAQNAGWKSNAAEPFMIKRRGNGRSWSVEDYLPEKGPMRIENTSGITMTPSGIVGDITVTASQPYFKLEHSIAGGFNGQGSIWRFRSRGQTTTVSASADDTWTPVIKVTGIGTARVFQITITGTWTGTVKLQFGFTEDGPWNDSDKSWTANVNESYDDGQEDSIVYYRAGFDATGHSSGTANITLVYGNGSIIGYARALTFNSSTSMDMQVLSDLGGTSATKDWTEGAWSTYRGYPTAVELHEGRLYWAGLDKIWGSVVDAYEEFDEETEGDAAPISRQIGSGPIRVIHWLISLGRLMFGTSDNSANVDTAYMNGNHPLGARSNSFDEPLTNANFNIKTISARGLFVDRTAQRLYELVYDIDQQDYRTIDLSVFAPDFNEQGIIEVAVQMKPDIRVHCVRSDGTVGMLVYDRLENVMCWCDITSPGAGGFIESVAVLPGTVEDQVYYSVRRTINAATERHISKWAMESEAMGATVNKIADSFAVYSGAATTQPFTTELLHLRDETVVVWADGVYAGDFVVSSTGGLTLTTAASDVVAGLGYQALYKSSKIGEVNGIGLLERKKVNRIGFMALWLHHLGLRYGPDFSDMSELPQTENGKTVATGTVWQEYHEDDFAFGGSWDADARICLEANAPKPVTLQAFVAELESIEQRGRR